MVSRAVSRARVPGDRGAAIRCLDKSLYESAMASRPRIPISDAEHDSCQDRGSGPAQLAFWAGGADATPCHEKSRSAVLELRCVGYSGEIATFAEMHPHEITVSEFSSLWYLHYMFCIETQPRFLEP